MDIQTLETAISFFAGRGVAASTARSYGSGLKRYVDFCGSVKIRPFPVSEQSLLLFVVALALQNLKAQTIKSYLAAVRYSQIMLHFPDPFLKGFPLLDYTVKGIKRVQAERGVKPKPRPPITPSTLRTLKAAWVPGTQVSSSMPGKDPLPSSGGDDRGDGIMLWAGAMYCFFGFLQAAEFTTPSLVSFDKGAHLAVGDVALDSHEKPSVVRLNIKASKTDPFRKGVQIFLGKTGTDICLGGVSGYAGSGSWATV